MIVQTMTSLSPIPMPSILALLLMLLLGFVQADSLLSCSVNNEDRDPALKEMAFDVGDGTEKVYQRQLLLLACYNFRIHSNDCFCL
jgi:hypothetical protein